MRMKSLWILLVMVLLVACGGGGEEGGSSDGPAVENVFDENGRQIGGVDEASGLAVNPEEFNPGDTIIVLGEIVTMNLTPTTSPEFVVQAEGGRRYRFQGQDLKETFFEDGSEIQLHEFKLGMVTQATIAWDASASLSDVSVSENVTIILDE